MIAGQRSTFALGLAISLGAVVLVSLNGGAEAHKLKCLGKDVDLKDCFKGFLECATTMMPAEDVKTYNDPSTSAEKKKELGIKAHKNMCIRVCQWKKHQHLLNEDGSLNKTGNDAILAMAFPEAAREGLKTGITKCHEEHSKNFKDEKECESYKPFENCMAKAYTDVCKVDSKQVHLDNM